MKKIILSISAMLAFGQVSFGQWSLTGNASTNPGTNYLGTSDNKDLVFKTVASEKMRITQGGNLGVGTATPVGRFEFRLPAFYIHNTTYGMRIDYPLENPVIGTPITNKSIFEVSETGAFSSSTKFAITRLGKVGVGTQNPDAFFNVEDDGTTALDAHLEGFTLIDGYESSLLFGRQTGAAYGEWGIEYNNVAGGLNFWKPAGGTTGYAGTNYHIFIKNDGKVGINTNNPTARLTVNGNVLIGDPATISIPNTDYKLFVETGILTEKVKVALETTADWADYVFQEDYKLMPLNQVENYVDQNGHLPGVPSAQEVKESGIDVAKMDAKLLEKIEELTLYMIQLKKENEAIKAELELLKK